MGEGLQRYREKRDFRRTPEPSGSERRSTAGLRFVVQKHAATRLHFDFRLELDGVLESWAVPRGPSLDPAEKRLAVHVEPHPLDYGDFEGTIPAGEYGGGEVILWDDGVWVPEGDPHDSLARGKLDFHLYGRRLRGRWTLVRTRRTEGDREAWLLLKDKDPFAATPGDTLVETRRTSIRTRRTLEDIAAGRSPRVPDAPDGPLPREIAPALATPVDAPPEGASWIHEIKLDGYRAWVRLEGGEAQVFTRSGKDWTTRFPEIARAVEALPARDALLDGEIVALDPDGRSRFGALQQALESGQTAGLRFYTFDLLHLDGQDLRSLPLRVRKDMLRQLVEDPPAAIRFTEHVQGQGAAFFDAACKLGLEGVLAKRADAPYRGGRGRDWLKVRCGRRQELVIVGWTDPGGSRTAFGALLVGYHGEGGLRFAGRVGTGFDEARLTSLANRMAPLTRTTPAVVDPPRGVEARGCHWIEPRLVAEVSFTEWTSDGRLRHPVFIGLREDKPPESVVREPDGLKPGGVAADADDAEPEPADPAGPAPKGTATDPLPTSPQAAPPSPPRAADHSASRAPRRRAAAVEEQVAGVALTHPERVYWPDANVTKLDLARYYDHVAEHLLPHVAHRPLTLLRCPDGLASGCFYQRHLTEGLPDGVHGVRAEPHGGGEAYLWIADRVGLVGLAQVGALEIHPWGVRVDRLDHPDRIIFDLDPGPGVEWAALVDAAFRTRDRLEAVGLSSFAKLTGGKGIHVVVPLEPVASWDAVRPFCRAVAEGLAHADPTHLTAKMARDRREGRVYIDYLRNTPTSTAAAPWSPRARPGAPVAIPVPWDALAACERGDRYHLHDLLGAVPADPWSALGDVEQQIDADTIRRLSRAR
jgi:bifunctional non-homologous end joining protein LigD